MVENLTPVLKTLETYVPEHFRRHIVVVGTSALLLHGIRVAHRIPDVDVLAPWEYLEDLHDRLIIDAVGDTSTRDEDNYNTMFDKTFPTNGGLRASVSLMPLSHHPELLKFQAFFGIQDQGYVMDINRAHELAVYTSDGYLALPPEIIIDWKQAINREKDQAFLKTL